MHMFESRASAEVQPSAGSWGGASSQGTPMVRQDAEALSATFPEDGFLSQLEAAERAASEATDPEPRAPPQVGKAALGTREAPSPEGSASGRPVRGEGQGSSRVVTGSSRVMTACSTVPCTVSMNWPRRALVHQECHSLKEADIEKPRVRSSRALSSHATPRGHPATGTPGERPPQVQGRGVSFCCGWGAGGKEEELRGPMGVGSPATRACPVRGMCRALLPPWAPTDSRLPGENSPARH